MTRITKEELKKRKIELAKHAREELAKTETMRFRLDPNNILKLYELAEKKRENVGSMVRQWVLERMESELYALSSPHSNRAKKAPLNTIMQRLDVLETEINRLSAHR